MLTSMVLIALLFLFPLVGSSQVGDTINGRLSDKGVADYVHTGDYNRALVDQLTLARDYLDLRIHLNERQTKPKQLAIVAAIDNTALAHEPRLRKLFVHPPMPYAQLWPTDEPVIWAFRAFYDYAVEKGVTVFFLTSRLESQRKNTQHNLDREGYVGWKQLLMRPTASTLPVAQEKTQARVAIEKQGYAIVLNISSKLDDLYGEHSGRVVLLPEPDTHRFRSLKGLNSLS